MDFTLIAATGDASLGAWLLAGLWTALTMALGLGFVIFVHELGHFLVAKAVGVKCEKFYVGFDFFDLKLGPITIPRALWKMKWGETEYGIGILPLGGYVKMLGQDDDPRNAASEAERIKVSGETDPDAHPFNPDDIRTSELAKGTSEEGLREGHTVERPLKLDPRSYPAKSVPARMAIISAGVIMNLIFAVVFAAIAYKVGIEETPAVIGNTLPGEPAWTAGLSAGDQILQFGRKGTPYEHLRWNDIQKSVVFNGADRDLEMLVRHTNGDEQWYEVRPSERLKEVTGHPSLGVTPLTSGIIGFPPGAAEFEKPTTDVPLEAGDKIVAINGEPIRQPTDIEAFLARNPAEAVTVTVQRTETPEGKAQAADSSASTKTITATVQPRPFRVLGLNMEIGPIVAVRKDSPASEAGFAVGDVITKVNGEPVGNPLSLPQRLAPKAGETVKFTVSRKDRSGKPTEKEISVAYTAPDTFFNEYFNGGPVGIDEIGIAYEVTNKVAEVEPDSPAAQAGVQPGDVIKAVEFQPQGDDAAKHWDEQLKMPARDVQIEGPLNTWTRTFFLMQEMYPDTKLQLVVDRAGKEQRIALSPKPSDSFFNESHGIRFQPIRRLNKAESWSQALRLGARETKERVGEVFGVLTRLLTGQISATNLSGPIGIGTVAWSAASSGPTVLLLFLTMLSANLAVLNFLPIPALDGGHMIFLAAEGIRGKPVDEQLQIRLTIAGVLCLLSLMLFATAMDFGRFFG